MYSEATLKALGTPFEIQPEVLAATERFDVEVYSDIYKDTYGFRPRMGLGDLSAEQLDVLWDKLLADHDEEMAAEDRRESEAMARWDMLVDETIAHGAGDYATAVRWLHQSQGLDGDDLEYLLFLNGVTSFANIRRVRQLAGME